MVLLAAAAGKPAAGAALDQVAIATGAAIVVTAALLYFGLGHRSGKVAWLGRLGAFSRRVEGVPEWAAVPAGMIVVQLGNAPVCELWVIRIPMEHVRDH